MLQINTFYDFLKQQELYINQKEITQSTVPIWEEFRSQPSDLGQDELIHLLYSPFGEAEFVSLLEGRYVRLDEEMVYAFKFDVEKLKNSNSFTYFDSVEEVWERVIKPKILEFREDNSQDE
jgi:hypothetical protein